MDVCGNRVIRLHDTLKESRLRHAIAKHKATIINSLYESYDRLLRNLTEDYYKQDIELDVSVLNLDEEDIKTQIQYYQQDYHRCMEVEMNFIGSRNLTENLQELRRNI